MKSILLSSCALLDSQPPSLQTVASSSQQKPERMETTTTTTTPTTTKPTSPPKKNKSKSFMASLLMSSPTSSSSSTSSSPTSFKEETHHLKSLQELKSALSSSTHFSSSSTIWGISLLSPSPSLDVVLLKFLRARDFRVPDALSMLERCLDWRKDFGADSILDEDLSPDFKDLEGVVACMSGFDRHGHPVCYNAYGVFRDRELYERVFGDEDKLRKFLRWRVQVLERGVALLHFKPGGVNSMIQVTDLKDMPKRELRVASAQILSLFQDNYPEMVARKIFINVPWYFSALYAMFNPFLTQRTKSKFVISREGYAADTLYKFIRPEDIPVQYGGLSRPGDLQSGPPKPASEFTVRGGEKVHIQIEGIEANATITWDLVVGGWDLEYSAEFIPDAEGSYTIAVEKPRGMSPANEAVRNSYTSRESGKIVISVDNSASRRKKVAAYRYVVRKSTGAPPF